MQKFSKKLVSKVIYVKILKCSSPELLESFLNEKVWELLNQWFTDAIKTSNWPLCTELLHLFAQCPISAGRLKENLDHNQAPRLVRQLSADARVDSGVRQTAQQLLARWMSVVSAAARDPQRDRPEHGAAGRGGAPAAAGAAAGAGGRPHLHRGDHQHGRHDHDGVQQRDDVISQPHHHHQCAPASHSHQQPRHVRGSVRRDPVDLRLGDSSV